MWNRTDRVLTRPVSVTTRNVALPSSLWQTAGGVLLTCLVAVPACVTLFAAAVAVIQPFSVDYGESVVYGHAMRIVQGEPLYQPIDVPPYTIVNYPPLFYWVAAALQAVVGPG